MIVVVESLVDQKLLSGQSSCPCSYYRLALLLTVKNRVVYRRLQYIPSEIYGVRVISILHHGWGAGG